MIRIFRFCPPILSAAIWLLTACSSDPKVDPVNPRQPRLTITWSPPTLQPAAGSTQLRFSTDEAWHIETAAGENADPWFEIDPMQGGPGEDISVSVRVNENTAYLGRSFTLTIRTASLEKSVEITQLKRNAIIAGENRYELSAEEQTLTVEILSNVGYEVEITEGREWLAADDSTRSEPGLSATEHRFTVGANSELQERSATVVFKDLASDLQDEVTVVQAAMADPDPERTALRAIYREANGGGWTNSDNWCTEKPLGEWYGVRTDDEGHVVELRLPQNNLRGAIAHEIANLGHLRILDLSRNELECELVYELPQDGTVRPDFWDYFRCDLDDLKLLEEIDLSHNKLYTSTNVPPSFREMNALRRVDLSYNRLECWISADTWRPMFENGRTVDMILNGNRMFEKVHDFIQNHPEWDRLAMQLVRQYVYDIGYESVHVPEFTFTDMRTGAQQSIRALCSQNERTMLLAWDPTDEKSIRFAERSVRRYHKLYGAQGLAVVAITPEGDRYKQAAEQYLATHEVEWPVVADYADAEGRRIILPSEPYPSYLFFDREGKLVDDVYTGTFCYGMAGEEPLLYDLTEREFQYANNMNSICSKIFGKCTYESTDYSMDKKTELLQRATRGNGVDLVLIGESFTDVDIETGFYKDAMVFAMESFFSVEPTKTYREYFNVHMVYAVSKRRQLTRNRTDSALWTIEDSANGIDGSLGTVDNYAAATGTVYPNRITCVVVNAHNAALTYINVDLARAIAYSGFSYNNRWMLRRWITHEAIGHALGWLGDEYSSSIEHPNPGEIPQNEKSRLLSYQHSGLDLNLSLTNDPKTVPWAHLIGHPRYPEVGLYEGGYIYQRGVWRSEAAGIMYDSSIGYFNTFCRELIVRRIFMLAGEEYTFEKFLEKDILPERTSYTPKHTLMDMEYVHRPPIF